MRVLHVVQRYPPAIGGAEVWCAGLARWQDAHGDTVRVLTLRAVHDDELWGDGTPPPTSIAVGPHDRDGGVRIERCATARPVGPALRRILPIAGLPTLTHANSAQLYGLVARRAWQTDVVHAHAIPGPHVFAAWLGARVARRPFFVTPHFHADEPSHEQRAVRAVLRRADGVIAVTRAETDGLVARGVPRERITTTSNAVDSASPRADLSRDAVRVALHVPAAAPLLCFIGRKHKTKDLDVLLAALPLVRHQPAPVLAMAGPSTEWFEQLKRRTRLDGVRDLPVVSDGAKRALLAAADLLVLPSRQEAFGIVFLEAWDAGTPVLGADIPAVREVIGDGGLTFRPGDPRDLASKIDTMLGSRSGEFVTSGRDRMRAEYTWSRIGAAVHGAYARALERRGARRTMLGRSWSWS